MVLDYLDFNSLCKCVRISCAWHQTIKNHATLWWRRIKECGVLGLKRRQRLLSRWGPNTRISSDVKYPFLLEEAVAATRIHQDIHSKVDLTDTFMLKDNDLEKPDEEGYRDCTGKAHSRAISQISFCAKQPLALVSTSCLGNSIKVWRAVNAVNQDGDIASELVAKLFCMRPTSAALDMEAGIVAAGTSNGALKLFRISSTRSVASKDVHKKAITAVLFEGSNIITGSTDGTVKTIRFSMPQAPSAVNSITFGKAFTIRDSGEPVLYMRRSGSTLGIGCHLRILFYERTDAGAWKSSQQYDLFHPLEAFDLSPGVLAVQTTIEFLSFSWSPLEPLGPDALQNPGRYAMWKTEPEDPFEPMGGQAALLGLSVPVLPLQMCAAWDAGNNVEEAPWRDTLGLSVAQVPGHQEAYFCLLKLGREGRRVDFATAFCFTSRHPTRIDLTCLSSNRHGLIAFGNAEGQVFLTSILNPSDLI
ncbi:hypothetical protein HDU96_005872 [Phlyctochytrium bullatum]|nr:hypothetical protein HDU96_005872 [Phlyctochytrium bullatum]